jgi:antitoxin component YwqK of YwqJK toxin-antitoxin module
MKYSPSLILTLTLILSSCGNGLEKQELTDALGFRKVFFVDPETGEKEGLSQEFGPQGKLAYEEYYRGGKLEGKRKIFAPNGQVVVEENYLADQFEGDYLNYDSLGNLVLKGQYISGAMNQAWFQYYTDGGVQESVTFVDNATVGPFREWYEDGKPKASGIYAPESKEDGLLHLYLETGGLERVMQCSIGLCTTIWTPDSTAQAPVGVDMTRPKKT